MTVNNPLDPSRTTAAAFPVIGDPDFKPAATKDEIQQLADESGLPPEPDPARAGWDLSWGARINYGRTPDGNLAVTLNLGPDYDGSGIVRRAVTPAQLAEHAKHLLMVAADEVDNQPSPHRIDSATADCLIWSNQRGMWWRPRERGYTAIIDEAGRYTLADAERIIANATCDGRLIHHRVNPVTGEAYQCYDDVIVTAPECAGTASAGSVDWRPQAIAWIKARGAEQAAAGHRGDAIACNELANMLVDDLVIGGGSEPVREWAVRLPYRDEAYGDPCEDRADAVEEYERIKAQLGPQRVGAMRIVTRTVHYLPDGGRYVTGWVEDGERL